MPKKPPKNAFFFFMLHFKDEEHKRGRYYPGGLMEISAAASQPWKEMNAQQRGPFEKQAKDAKCGPQKVVEKYTSQGIPLSLIEKEQKELENEHRTMLRTIKDMVQSAFTNNSIGSMEMIFISANYFTNINGTYLPAELALVRFSLEYGIVNKFHTYVDPQKIPTGYQFDAKDNSEKTHRLPIPPNAKGEKMYGRIVDEIHKFVGTPTPILFTTKENIPMIKSIFDQLTGVCDGDQFRVYPLHQIFYEIKEKAVRNSVVGVSFKSIHIAEEHLRRDDYTYLSNTACSYHDEIDCVKHCALAHVQKWAYIFCDHICVDLNIDLISGKHFPPEIDVSQAVPSEFSSSQLNFTDTSTYTREPEVYNRETEIHHYNASSSSTSHATAASHWPTRPKSPGSSSPDDHFPTLGSRNRRTGASKKRSDERNVNNPWNTSSSSSNDANTSYSRGMGRGSALFQHESVFGRGRSHNDHDRRSERKRSGSFSRHDSKRCHSRKSSESGRNHGYSSRYDSKRYLSRGSDSESGDERRKQRRHE